MKERLDVLLVRRQLCPSRERAKAEIRAGTVFVDGAKAEKPGQLCEEGAALELRGEALRYVSRGGLKLERALTEFAISPAGKFCLDCGASTGGFTDCMLQNGARLVCALDVGTNQLAESLRSDGRVIVMEQFNARNLRAEDLPAAPEFITADVSFISLRLILPALAGVLAADGDVVVLVKPQFEAGRERLGKNGVVRDPETHRQVLSELLEFFPSLGLYPQDLTWSPIRGPEGNIEYLCHLRRENAGYQPDIPSLVAEAHRVLT